MDLQDLINDDRPSEVDSDEDIYADESEMLKEVARAVARGSKLEVYELPLETEDGRSGVAIMLKSTGVNGECEWRFIVDFIEEEGK